MYTRFLSLFTSICNFTNVTASTYICDDRKCAWSALGMHRMRQLLGEERASLSESSTLISNLIVSPCRRSNRTSMAWRVSS